MNRRTLFGALAALPVAASAVPTQAVVGCDVGQDGSVTVVEFVRNHGDCLELFSRKAFVIPCDISHWEIVPSDE